MEIEQRNKELLEKITKTNFSNHLSSSGVMRKGTPTPIRKLWFIKKCFEKFGLSTFDFSIIEFTNTKELVVIECQEHGKFSILPNNFLNNIMGCPKCGYKHRKLK